jgi:hypothetical protein
MIKKITLFFLLIISHSALSQEIKRYTWDEKPTFKIIPEEYKDQPAVVLFDKRWIHTRVGSYAFATFVMNHTAVKIIKAEEINKYNKIKAEDNGYIRDLRDFHARIIKPNGEIKVLSKDKIVETEIDKVKSIVFEGVEAGDILEYYFILKENPNAYGFEVFQQEIPVLEAEFSTSKEGVNFETFSSNEFTKNEKNGITTLKATNIPPFVEEKDARNIKNLIKIIYMISTSNYDNFSWSYFFPTYFSKPSFQYFIKIDEYIKENFDFIARGEKASKITNLNTGKLKLKANDVFDLYGFTLKELKIPYKVVAGMSRFIGDISTFKYVVPLNHEFMYYIPETQKFISPFDKYLSYGYPMYEIQGSDGITYSPNMKESTVGTAIKIPITPAEFTTIETQSNVVLLSDFSTAEISKVLSSTGYEGQLYRNTTKYLKENEEEKETIDFIKKRVFKGIDIKIIDYNYENKEFKNNYSNKPFIIKVNAVTIEPLVENAGNLLLVNLGKVIGEQDNLYQEEKRKFDVDLRYSKIYKHKIIFTIPDGYQVESYNDLLIDKKMEGDPTKTCSFKSNVKIEGNQLIIEVVEQYLSINYPVSSYQEYRKVLNTSANFTKATLVLKPKQ